MECGNLAYHPTESPTVAASSASEPLLTKEEEAFLGPVHPVFEPEEIESVPMIPADSKMVDSLLLANQQEWQLWGELVKHFNDENNHQAYLSFVTRYNLFDKAMERYLAHRKTFMVIAEDQWQAEIADLKLDLLRSISEVQMQRNVRSQVKNSSSNWLLQPWRGAVRLRLGFSLIFVSLGLFLGAAITILLNR